MGAGRDGARGRGAPSGRGCGCGAVALRGAGGLPPRRRSTARASSPPTSRSRSRSCRGAPRVPPRVLRRAARFTPRWAPRRWPVPRIDTVGDLAAFLELDAGAARVVRRRARARARRCATSGCATTATLRVPRAAGPPRVIERPKPRLKALQRRDPARDPRLRSRSTTPRTGSSAGRSARTHAAPHVGPARGRPRSTSRTSSRPSTAARVYGIFRTAGYPEAVAHALTGLCTNVVPVEESVPGHCRLSRRLATPHLPQGAPTSPALANLAAFALDRRLTGLAAAIGATLHPLRRRPRALRRPRTCARRPTGSPTIARDEGFRVNAAKTRVMGRGRRQTRHRRSSSTPTRTSRAPSTTALKAILHRAALDGPAASTRPSCSAASPGSSRSTRPAASKLRDVRRIPGHPRLGVRPIKSSLGSTAPFQC